MLKVGVAGQPSFWKQGREMLQGQGCHIPIGLQQGAIPQQDARDAVLFVAELCSFSIAQNGRRQPGSMLW